MSGQSSRVTGRDSRSSSVVAGVPAWLSRFSIWIDLGTATLNGFGILITLGLMLAINIDVAGRTLFGSPIDGIPELVTLCVVSIVFL
ncbi:MAG: hypothetical protein HKN42_04870, partial [Granulosicoccus sp.]|nr:hypothetical protein [Granulosicoccus sp.]